MDNKFVPPPPIDPQTQEAMLDAAEKMTELDWFLLDYRFRNDPRFRKYRERIMAHDKARRRSRFSSWWWSKGIQIVNLILALIAAVTGVLALLR